MHLNTCLLIHVNDKVRPRIGYERPEEEQIHISTISLTSALDGGWVVKATPQPLYPRERDPVPIL
jgi:hypothetical protein